MIQTEEQKRECYFLPVLKRRSRCMRHHTFLSFVASLITRPSGMRGRAWGGLEALLKDFFFFFVCTFSLSLITYINTQLVMYSYSVLLTPVLFMLSYSPSQSQNSKNDFLPRPSLAHSERFKSTKRNISASFISAKRSRLWRFKLGSAPAQLSVSLGGFGN